MPQFDIMKQPFLPPEHEAVLTPMRSLLHDMEFPANPEVPAEDRMGTLINRVVTVGVDSSAYVREQRRQKLNWQASREEAEQALSISALTTVSVDLGLRTLLNAMATSTGLVEATSGDEAMIARGYAIGERIIDYRAKHTATAVLGAVATLYEVYPALDGQESTWEKARNAHDRNPKAKSPVDINEVEGSKLQLLIDKSWDGVVIPPTKPLIKFGRSKTMNVLRVVKATKKIIRDNDFDSSAMGIDLMDIHLDALLAGYPGVLDLEPAEIATGMRTIGKVRRYLASAAFFDPDLRTDPKARLVTYLGQELSDYDIRSERAVFERDVKKVAKHERKHMQ